jgi:hypothetical protein
MLKAIGRADVAVLYLSRTTAVKPARHLLVDFRVKMCAAGRGPYRGGSTPSSGLIAAFVALQLCEAVTLYGFNPNDKDASTTTTATKDFKVRIPPNLFPVRITHVIEYNDVRFCTRIK